MVSLNNNNSKGNTMNTPNENYITGESLHDFCSEHCHETWCAETGNDYTGHENHAPIIGANCSQCYEVIGAENDSDSVEPAYDPCEICGKVAPLDGCGVCFNCAQ